MNLRTRGVKKSEIFADVLNGCPLIDARARNTCHPPPSASVSAMRFGLWGGKREARRELEGGRGEATGKRNSGVGTVATVFHGDPQLS